MSLSCLSDCPWDLPGFSSALKACVGQPWPLAVQLLRPSPSLYEVNGVIAACEKGGVWDRALWILFAAPREFKAETFCFGLLFCGCWLQVWFFIEKDCSILDFHALCFNFFLINSSQKISQIFRQVSPDLISYSSAISACATCGLWDAALWLLSEMAQKRIAANDISSLADSMLLR